MASDDHDGGFPDLGGLGDGDLRELIGRLTERAHTVSYERRLLHGKIDLLRAELESRDAPEGPA
jgi:hypothetical protein